MTAAQLSEQGVYELLTGKVSFIYIMIKLSKTAGLACRNEYKYCSSVYTLSYKYNDFSSYVEH